MMLFPFSEYWWFYGAFTLFVLALLALDLGVFHRKAHAVTVREATTWTVVWFLLAGVFNYGLYLYAANKFGAEVGRQVGLEFLTGFVVEKTLAIDNIFVFAMVFGFFAVRPEHKHRILFYGILGALGFRALFIALGSYLMAYHAVVLAFGVILIFTGVKMFFAGEKEPDPEMSWVMRLLRKVLPIAKGDQGGSFFTRVGGKWHVTSLFVALAFIEVTDILFAIDSVPAIFAITKEPLIVFTSNIFAILGLRSLYFLLADVMGRFSLIKYGLAAVLVFVGLKMVWLNQLFDGKFPISWSLGVIALLIGSSVVASLVRERHQRTSPEQRKAA